MAIIKIKQIREMQNKGLDSKLAELRLELLKEQGNVKMGRPIKNTGKIGEIKRTIARLETIKNEMKTKIKMREVKSKNG